MAQQKLPRGATGRFAGFTTAKFDEHQGSLEVLGLPCTVFKDEGTAQFIDQERHLLPWFGDETNLVDRYDVRLLLDDLSTCDNPSLPAAAHGAELEGQEAADLHKERYADMDYAQEHQLAHPLGRPVGDAGGDDASSEEGSSSGSEGGLVAGLPLLSFPLPVLSCW
mmetsp:Transcript_26673/g.68750  ORF Transcript_26673/g.68750 Transcript_26673/m.68750 type:complete len:166 (+) Transcript_26673:1376-1873(+)